MQYFNGDSMRDGRNMSATAQFKLHSDSRVGAMLDQLDAELALKDQRWVWR